MGKPFFIKRRATGTMPHSQTGKTIPRRLATPAPNMGDWGISRLINVSGTNTCMIDETSTPSNINGNASSVMLVYGQSRPFGDGFANKLQSKRVINVLALLCSGFVKAV